MDQLRLARAVIRGIIKEAAISAKQAGSEKLALYYGMPQTGEWQTDSVYILYSPQALVQNIEEHGMEASDYGEIIYGVIALDEHEGDCNNASAVNNVAAQKGYGPLLYQIAMTREGEITSSRQKGGVKKGAENVWRNFYSQGQARAKPFDDPEDPRDDDPTNDCDLHGIAPLDHSYSGIRAPFGPLLQKHNKFMQEMSDQIDKDTFIELLERLASSFYFEKYIGSPF